LPRSPDELIGFVPKSMCRKRLQNMADNICRMFCGWRLSISKPMLVELGSGTLEIDVLTGACMFQNNPAVQLGIARELRSWMQSELLAHRIPITAIMRARLNATLSFREVPWNTRTREIFFADNKAVRSEKMHHCTLDCESEVATDEIVYRSKLREVQEWPLGWPKT
jgi:hypothetical protein